MKTKRFLLILFLCLGILFVIGSAFGIPSLLIASNFLLVPVLLLYYRIKARRIFVPVFAVLLLLYIRDIFMIYGIEEFLGIIWTCFILAVLILFTCMATGFKRSRIHPVELLSFLIMYSFLIFLFITLSDGVSERDFFPKWAAYSYLFLLMLLMAGSFTKYIMKSHMASLWFMVAASSFLVSEVSLFFKIFIIEDISVNFFYPSFHVLTYYALVEYGLRRRQTGNLHFF